MALLKGNCCVLVYMRGGHNISFTWSLSSA